MVQETLTRALQVSLSCGTARPHWIFLKEKVPYCHLLSFFPPLWRMIPYRACIYTSVKTQSSSVKTRSCIHSWQDMQGATQKVLWFQLPPEVQSGLSLGSTSRTHLIKRTRASKLCICRHHWHQSPHSSRSNFENRNNSLTKANHSHQNYMFVHTVGYL